MIPGRMFREERFGEEEFGLFLFSGNKTETKQGEL